MIGQFVGATLGLKLVYAPLLDSFLVLPDRTVTVPATDGHFPHHTAELQPLTDRRLNLLLGRRDA